MFVVGLTLVESSKKRLSQSILIQVHMASEGEDPMSGSDERVIVDKKVIKEALSKLLQEIPAFRDFMARPRAIKLGNSSTQVDIPEENPKSLLRTKLVSEPYVWADTVVMKLVCRQALSTTHIRSRAPRGTS